MQEVPHRVVIDLQDASGKLGNEPVYGEIAVLDPFRQPHRVVARNHFSFVTTYVARLNAAGLIDPLHPADRRAELRDIPPCIAATTRLRNPKNKACTSMLDSAQPAW